MVVSREKRGQHFNPLVGEKGNGRKARECP